MATLTVSALDEKRVKAMGFLSNKGTDNFSGRIITVNGKITAAQQKCIAEAAEKFGNGTITFTTRLTIEVQGIPYDKIEDFQAYIAKEGLVTGGTGSVVRPVGLLGSHRNSRSSPGTMAVRMSSVTEKPFSSRRGNRETLQSHNARAFSYSEKVGAVTRALPFRRAAARR